MRHTLATRLARLAAPVAAAGALILGGGTPALAASDGAAQPFVMDLADAWCFDETGPLEYCFDVQGKAVFQDNRAGSSVTITVREHTVITRDGSPIGESRVVQLIRGVYRADGTVSTQDVQVVKSDVLGESCTYQLVLRIADYDLVVDHVTSTCGG